MTVCDDQGVRRLLPPPTTTAVAPLTVDDLAAHYAYPPDGAVRANMVTSVDGAISLDGRSKPISGRGDWFLFGLQRALADVVLVGAGTARAEGYGPGRARPEFAHLRRVAGQAGAPTMAIVTRSGAIDPDAEFLGGPHRPVVISCQAAAAALTGLQDRADVIVSGHEEVDLHGAVTALRDRGMTRVLTEGGPSLLGSLADRDLIDELVVTISPTLVAGDSARLVHGGTAALRPLQLVGLLEEESALFAHYRRERNAT